MAQGLAGVVVACLGFGTQCCFIKGRRITEHHIDPLLVALLFSAAAGLIGAATLGALALLERAPPRAGWAGVLAALCFAPGNVLLLCSARRIGVAWRTSTATQRQKARLVRPTHA